MQNGIIDFSEKKFKLINNIVFTLALLLFCGQIFEYGIIDKSGYEVFRQLFRIINFIFGVFTVSWTTILFYNSKNNYIKWSRFGFAALSMIYLTVSAIGLFNEHFANVNIPLLTSFFGLIIAFVAVSYNISTLGNTSIHPANLFVISFLFLIFFGAFCLILPAATTRPITFIQALFTSTSAVTVTGLAVLDTGKDYTIFGQVIILILIQLGGLGVLTVTNIFALIFKSSSTFRNRMMVSDMIKEMDKNNTFSTLFKIVFITLVVEFIGAIIIYICIANENVVGNPIFFSIFHAISAFCNAGFSPLSNNIFEESVRFNYPFQLTICWLIVTGGLGYLVMIEHYKMIKNVVLHKICYIPFFNVRYTKTLIKQSSNSKIVLKTTFLLLLIGTVLFYLFEYNNTLVEHNFFGKIVVSLFNSVTPRTAGFNNLDMGQLAAPAIMLLMALMWIGASPGSTGGGIKTTTFAIAILNLFNQIRGRETLILRNKEIPPSTLNQVSAVLLLSIIAIGSATTILSLFEPTKLFRDLLFETISAYSTVGLSLNLTPSLSPNSHIVLVVVMFLGRVSFLTLLTGLFSTFLKDDVKGVVPYYPKENVIIN
jgi:trk system potassium uptake protein